MLRKIIAGLIKTLTRCGTLAEDLESIYLADSNADSDDACALWSQQADACNCRSAFVPRAGQKVFTVQATVPRDAAFFQVLCADLQDFSLHAAVRCSADERNQLVQLCRCIRRPALANESVQCNIVGQVALKLKSGWRNGITHIFMSPLEFMECPAVQVLQQLRLRATASGCSI